MGGEFVELSCEMICSAGIHVPVSVIIIIVIAITPPTFSGRMALLLAYLA
jgi:hypothetical protein